MRLRSIDTDRQQRRRQKRRQEIYDAAMRLFVERGYEQVTVEEIAAAADVAKGTFFNYFPSKEHLLVEYRRSLFDFVHEVAESLEGPSARDLFQEYFGALARRIQAERETYGVLLREVVARPHLIALDGERQEKYLVYAVRFLETGRVSGEVPPGLDLELLARTIRDIWDGTSIGWVLQQDRTPLELRIAQKLDLVFDVLTGRYGA